METADTLALVDLQHRYGDVVSRRAWGELGELFQPDCRVELALRTGDRELVGADAVVDFVSTAVAAFDVFVFEVLNSVVDPDASGRMWIHELRWLDGQHSDPYGLYEDRFARDLEGHWRFASRRYTSISGGRFRP